MHVTWGVTVFQHVWHFDVKLWTLMHLQCLTCWLKATSCPQTCMTIESNISQRLWTVLSCELKPNGFNILPSSISCIGESVLIWWSCLQQLPWKHGDGYDPYSGAIMQWNIFIVVMFQENISCLLTVEIVQRSSHPSHACSYWRSRTSV